MVGNPFTGANQRTGPATHTTPTRRSRTPCVELILPTAIPPGLTRADRDPQGGLGGSAALARMPPEPTGDGGRGTRRPVAGEAQRLPLGLFDRGLTANRARMILLFLADLAGGRCELACVHRLIGNDTTVFDRAVPLLGLQGLIDTEERCEPGNSNLVVWAALTKIGLRHGREPSAAPATERRVAL